MPLLRTASLTFLAVFLTPLALHAAWWLSYDKAVAWDQADWSSAKLLPAPRARPQALVHVYAARTGRWEYVFYVDLLRGDDPSCRDALRHLGKTADMVKVLGIYPAA